MKTHPLTAKNWFVVALIALVLGVLFIAPFLGVVALAALIAFLFYGTYERMARRIKPGIAATLTFLFSLVIVVVPIILIGVFTAFQLAELAANLTTAFNGDFSSLPSVVQNFINDLNKLVAPIAGTDVAISGQGIVEFLRNTLPGLLQGVASFITGVIGNIPMAIILTIMYIFLFYEFLVFGKKIHASIIALSPFQPEVTRMYLARVGLMANAMAKGQLVIALILGSLEAAAICFFFNAWEFFVLMTVAFSFFNLIPLGAGVVAYPIVIIGMLMGSFWPGIGALIAISIISNLESFLRPKFIPKSITLTNGLTMLAAFAGISMFGLLGVVYGPIIMIIIVTSIQMYLDYYQDLPTWKKNSKI